MKKLLLVCGILALTASSAMAAGHLGLHNSDCHGTQSINNLCTSNTGAAATLVCSVISPVAIPLLTAIEGTMDLSNGLATLSPWWHMEQGGCSTRPAALTASYDFTTTDVNGNPVYVSCVDFWAGAGSGGIGFVTPSTGSGLPGGSARIGLVCANATANPADNTSEYYMARVAITRAVSVGTNCPGCLDGINFCLNDLKLQQPAGSPGGDTDVEGTAGDQQCVSYNGGTAPTPTQRTTWGSVKALYR